MLGYIFRLACWAYSVEVTPGKVNIKVLVEAEPRDVIRSLGSVWGVPCQCLLWIPASLQNMP